jgi:hypothetical protein
MQSARAGGVSLPQARCRRKRARSVQRESHILFTKLLTDEMDFLTVEGKIQLAGG